MTIVVLIRPPCILLRPKAPLRRLNWIQTNDKTETSAKQQIHKPSIFFQINFLFLFLIIIHKCWELKKQDRSSPIYIITEISLSTIMSVLYRENERFASKDPHFANILFFTSGIVNLTFFSLFICLHLKTPQNTPLQIDPNLYFLPVSMKFQKCKYSVEN